MDEDFHPALYSSHEAVEQAFYDALERGDIDALMACWSEDDDIVCIHPHGPRLVGAAVIRRSFEQMMASGPLRIRPTAVMVQSSLMAAAHTLVEQVLALDDPGAVYHVFATNLYVKTPSGWRLVLHHASPIPEGMAVDVESAAARRPTVLH